MIMKFKKFIFQRVCNGYADNLSILGKAKILDAVIPSISTTIEKMSVNFNEKLISTKNTVINIAGSKATIKIIEF